MNNALHKNGVCSGRTLQLSALLLLFVQVQLYALTADGQSPLPPPPPPPFNRYQQRPPAPLNSPENSMFMQYQLERDDHQPPKPSQYTDRDEYTNKNYNLIEGKPFVEQTTSRCMASTIVADTKAFEPSFVFIKPMSEVRLNATAPLDAIKLVTHFEAQKPTVILVHGYTQSYPQTEWLRRVRALFEMHTHLTNYNLIIMDWTQGAENPYNRAAAMTSLMGSFLSNFIDKLIALGANRLSIQIIGHSLGAHVAGFAGRRLKPRIGRITALDPAGPCFGKLYSNSEQDRLNSDDAIEVDVFHYDDEFLGLGGQHGQFDIYVNGGSSQPGATDNINSMVGALITVVFGRKKVLSESHTRSYQVMMADLAASSNCQLIAYECADYPSFVNGECGTCDEFNNQCFSMSFPFQYNHGLAEELMQLPLRTSSPGRRFFISTQGNDPYCLFHDQVLVKLEPHPKLYELAKKKKLSLRLELFYEPIDRGYSSINVTLTNLMTTNAYSFLMLSSIERRNKFRSARLHATSDYDKTIVPLVSTNNNNPESSYSNSDKLEAIKLTSVEINHMSKFDPSARRALSSRLCPLSTPSTLATVNFQSFQECTAMQQTPYKRYYP